MGAVAKMTLQIRLKQGSLIFYCVHSFPSRSQFLCINADLQQMNLAQPFDITSVPTPRPIGPILPLGVEFFKILSPDLVEGVYPNNQLCRYSFPECPVGHVQQLFWSNDDFLLQEPFEGTTYCLDFVQLFLFSLNLPRGGASLDMLSLPEQVLCGSQGIFHVKINTKDAVQVRARI